MIIHQLEIHNFKSYQGTHIIGPFDLHFNCVIGPNGNGKSNIIDSVLFAFGFKSSKLRQDSLVSLIHKSAFAKPDRATVKVVFREGQQFLSVSRSILKSGNSYYKLNDEKTTWNELKQKLIEKRIDLDKNLFIILQGQVQRLCQLSPQTMVEYLEYVSGSDELKEPIENTQKEYIESSVAKEENKLLLCLKKESFDRLRQQAIKQITWVFLKLRIILYQHTTIKRMIFEKIHETCRLKQQQWVQVGELNKVEQQIVIKKEELGMKREELNDMEGELKKGEQLKGSIQQRQRGLDLKLRSVGRQIVYISRDKQKGEQQRGRYLHEMQQINRIKENGEAFLLKYQQVKKMLGKVGNLNHYKKCYQLQCSLQEVRKEKQYLQTKGKEESMNLKADREKLRMYELKYKQNMLRKERVGQQMRVLMEQREQAVQRIGENEERRAELERRLQDKNSSKIVTNQQRMIQQIKNANRLKLICPDYHLATLRDLLIIDTHYLTLVETILPHLDYFIVQTLKQAREVAQYLSSKKIGRSTILIKQLVNESVKDIKIVDDCPKQTQLIINLCTCSDQQTKNMLIWALGNTLVTHSLDVAMKVSYYDQKKYRVITTNGQLIDLSGTITKLSFKNAPQQQDQQLLAKKLQALKKIQSGLCIKRQALQKGLLNLRGNLLEVQQQQRSFEGLDEVLLEQGEREIKQDAKRLQRARVQQEGLSTRLVMLMQGLEPQMKVNGLIYTQIIALIRSYADNQSTIKTLETSNNLLQSLDYKSSNLQKSISAINTALTSKVKEKVSIQNQKMKMSTLIHEINQKLQMIEYGRRGVSQYIRGLEQQIKGLQCSNASRNKLKSKELLKKIRNRLKEIEYQQVEMRNKLFVSIREIKEFGMVVCRDVYGRYPELIAIIDQQQDGANQSRRVTQQTKCECAQEKILDVALTIGREEWSFVDLLSRKEIDYLLKEKRGNSHSNFYGEIDGIRLQSQKRQGELEMMSLKELQFSQSYEQSKLKYLQKQMQRYDGSEWFVNFEALQEYAEKKTQYQSQVLRMTALEAKIEAYKRRLIQLRNNRLEIFMTIFNQINIQLNLIYNKLTGGKAELNFIDSINPFQGVQFSVRPVNKSWKRVNLLSGGQKTFTSLALIFACEQIKKFPFYFMDQIDAALDYKNTTLLSQYIKEKVHTQHIVISLRKNMYQESNHIVGVYKIQDQSRTIEISMHHLSKSPSKS